MTGTRLKYLLTRYVSQQITPVEFEELLSYLYLHPHDKELTSAMEEVMESEEHAPYHRVPTSEMYRNIIEDARFRESTPKPPIRNWKTLRYGLGIAASLAAIWMLYSVFISQQFSSQAPSVHTAKLNSLPAIMPGTKSAILSLSDGTSVFLDNETEQRFETKQGVKVQLQDNRISYQLPHDSALLGNNTIRTPIGSEFHFILPDGTKVWLNAGSSISYSPAFSKGNREISMTGELYFEVAASPQHPFIVKVGQTSIHVLGTRFNVHAYPDEPTIKTTLINGSVQIEQHRQKKVLHPGQQAEISERSHTVQVREVDVQEPLAWKNGYFSFNDEALESVMKTISRWYNVEIVYEGDFSDKKLDGTISKMEHLPELLSALEITGTAHFNIQGRRIIVKK